MARVALLIALPVLACMAHHATTKPIRRTLNFNMFLLQPNKNKPDDRVLFTTDGVSRFGPLLEYFIQRVQGMLSVRVPEHHQHAAQLAAFDASENEVDSAPQSRTPPGVVVRPSQTKPGTYEVEINVLVDDGQPESKKNYNRI